MPDNNDQLLLYEALELRAEYESRIKTLQDCLPEAQKSSNRFGFNRDDQVVKRPSADFDPSVVRKTVKNLEYKHRKLNSAVQVSNFTTTIEYDGDKINLNEALELRKSINDQIAQLHTQVVDSAYQRVIYKEGRDIVEENPISYQDASAELEQARMNFRELNRKLRRASFDTVVPFKDE